MSEWITDRLPNVENSDIHGQVWISDCDGYVYVEQFDQVKLGTPWQTIANKPAPYVKPEPPVPPEGHVINEDQQPQKTKDNSNTETPYSVPTDDNFIGNVCLSYDHGLGLLTPELREYIIFQCKEWIRAINNNLRYAQSKPTKFTTDPEYPGTITWKEKGLFNMFAIDAKGQVIAELSMERNSGKCSVSLWSRAERSFKYVGTFVDRESAKSRVENNNWE
jgi:hypothetical protein